MTPADPVNTSETAAPAEAAPVPKTVEQQEREAKILADFRMRLRESSAHRKEWRDEARMLYDMAAGRQWDAEDEAYLKDNERPAVTFNVSGKYMDALTGLQINNRQDIRYAPREQGDVAVNETLTGAVAWGRDLSGMADDETDSFYDCILTGEGWMEGFVDRDLDPSGVPCGARVDPLEMFPDPVARRRNYEDGRYCIRIKWVSQEDYDEAMRGVPGYEAASEPGTAEGVTEEEDTGLQFIETPHDYGTSSGGSPGKPRKPLADYQWFEREDAFIVNAEGLGMQTFSAAEWEPMKQRLIAAGTKFSATPIRRKCYYRAIIGGNLIANHGRCSNRNGFTFHAITGKRDRNKRVWFGIGRALVDPQKWVNKFFSTILFVLMTNAKGGVMAEENTFTDARKAEDTWASPDSIVHLKEGALQKGKIAPKPAANYPQGMDRLMEFSLNALPQTSGLNLELLGLADRVQAGVVEAQRKQSAMAIVAWAFDGMRRYYRSMGRMLADYVKDYMNEGTLVQITGQQGKKYVPLVKAQLNNTFDVIVDEAPTSVNQQERVWAVLQSIIPQLLQAGIAIPPAVLDYAPLPQDLKDEWHKAVTPDPQKQAIQAGTLKATLDKLIAEVQASNAKAQLDGSSAALNNAKAQEILKGIGATPAQVDPNAELNAKLNAELFETRMKLAVEQSIAALKADKDAETKLLVAQLQADSAERQALLTSTIDARLEALRIASDERVASAAAKQDGQQADHAALLKDAVGEMKDTMAKSVEGLAQVVKAATKPKKIKRDAKGDIVGVE